MGISRFLSGDQTSRKEKLLAIIAESSSQTTIDDRKSFLGRTRLIKAVFLAQYLDYNGDSYKLDTSLDFSNYEFFLYSHGPFSTEVMEDLEDLNSRGFLNETGSSSGNRLKLTSKGQERVDEIEDSLKDVETNRIKKISEIVSGKNGRDLEEMSLELLNIEEEEKTDWMGFDIENIIESSELNALGAAESQSRIQSTFSQS